jgi:N-acetylmuramoyl-L-alanine amidase
MKSLRLMLCAMPLMLTGCSTMSSVNWSAANPWNWFGSSTKVSEHILKKIKPVHKLHSRNTEQAAFVVLKSPSVPSVLVETSFITNPEEERLLGTAAFRQKIATAIAEGVISYFHWFDNQKAHSRKR